MKLRLHDDSLRFRLKPAEVEHLICTGNIRAATVFGGGELVYQLRSDANARGIQASLHAGEIAVSIPMSMAADWAKGDAIAMKTEQPAGNGRVLRILIEKDFECLHDKANEPGEKYYPNPASASSI